MESRPKYVATLATAESVAFGPVGADATILEETWAYKYAVADGDLAVAHFEWLLENGTAAARLYAAFGLRDVARERGQAVLDELEDDDTAVEHLNGCFAMETTVGDVVRSLRGTPQPLDPDVRRSSPLVAVLISVVPVALLGYWLYSCGSW